MNEFAPILAIETSGDLCSVCVYQSSSLFSEINIQRKHIHSELLMTLVEQCISNMGVNKAELKSVAVSMGPGSFTGLRIGMSVAKSIAFGLQLPIIAVPTYEALAYFILKLNFEISRICIVNKVNRDELYMQKFDIDNLSLSPQEIQLIKSDQITEIDESYNIYGNLDHSKVTLLNSPSSLSISEWAYIFGQDLVTFDYDYLEPNYIKNFIAKVKK